MDLTPGTLLSRYRIETFLGRGGMGEVYKARDEALGRSVALKILRSDLPLDEGRVHRFLGEARIASSLNHPHLLHVYDVGESDGRRFIAMEYVDGQTFRAVSQSPASLSTLVRYLLQTAEALAKAHDSGIVHRDLKPENILVTSDGYAKVADFGLAKLVEARPDSEPVTADGTVVGTVGYMSPEQVRGERVDHRTDIFAFGCILHEAITRTRTFSGASAFETLERIVNADPAPLPAIAGPGLQQIVDRCLAKRREERYSTMREVVRDLREALAAIESDAGLPTEQLPAASSGKREAERSRRRVVQRAIVGVLAALGIAAALLLVPRIGRQEPVQQPAQLKPTAPPAAPLSAEDAYLRAKVILADETRENADKAIALLKGATAANPRYAPAWAELARAYGLRSFYYARAEEQARLEEEGNVAVEKALALDPRLGRAHTEKGRLLWTHGNRFPHELAIRAYRQAIALDPTLDDAHHQLGIVYFHVGLLDEAEKEINAALAINPANTLARFRLGVIAMYRGRHEEALAYFRSTPLKKNPSLWSFQTANSLFCLGRTDEANRLLDEFLKSDASDQGGTGHSVRAMILAKEGKRAETLQAIRDAIRLGEGYGHFHHAAYNIGSAYALLGDPSEARKWLEVAADDGFPCHPLFATDPNLASLHGDPAFARLLARIKVQMEKCSAIR
jgi:tetratricopeptide (TPR) repeat protein/predicted Ser/Thr protein kinase